MVLWSLPNLGFCSTFWCIICDMGLFFPCTLGPYGGNHPKLCLHPQRLHPLITSLPSMDLTLQNQA